MTNKPICETDGNGTKHWWLNGNLHRTDGPAVEYANGTKEWYLNDKLHRTDGPAVVRANDTEWRLNGERVTMEDVITDPKELFWWKMKT